MRGFVFSLFFLATTAWGAGLSYLEVTAANSTSTRYMIVQCQDRCGQYQHKYWDATNNTWSSSPVYNTASTNNDGIYYLNDSDILSSKPPRGAILRCSLWDGNTSSATMEGIAKYCYDCRLEELQAYGASPAGQ